MIAVVFSKDRPLQLDATLRSFMLHCLDFTAVSVKVIVKASTPECAQGYIALEADYTCYSNITFIVETDFRGQVLHLIGQARHLLWLVDDNIFVRDFELQACCHLLDQHRDVIGFSLRLGCNTVFCYPLDRPQSLPDFVTVGRDALKFNWTSAEYDFGYPLEVSSSLYRCAELQPVLAALPFFNPNSLEEQLSRQAHSFRESHPYLLCPERSYTFCNPINKVQTTCATNRAGETCGIPAEELLDAYLAGKRVDLSCYAGFIPNACHQEVPLYLVDRHTSAPVVSVIIPCYNQACYLADAVQSVVDQTYADWECIIVNDGSPDDTSDVAKNLIARFADKNIRLLEKTNGGLSDARNAGIADAKGCYILPLDADDILHPEMLTKTVAYLESHPEVAIVYTDLEHFGAVKQSVVAAEYDLDALRYANQLNYCSLYRRSMWEDVGGYSRTMHWGYEDWDFWLACGEKGYYGHHLPEPLLYYRVKNESMLTRAREHEAELMAQIILNHPGLYSAEERQLAHSYMNNLELEQSRNRIQVAGNAENSVLIACTHFWPSVGGVETIAENLCVQLLQCGYAVTVATLANAERNSASHRGIHIISLTTDRAADGLSKWIFQLRELICSGRYTACILLADPRNMIIWSIAKALIPPETRLIIQPIINQEGYQEWCQNYEFRADLARILKQADAAVALTRSGPEVAFMRGEGVLPVYLPNAVAAVVPQKDFRRTYGIGDDEFLVLNVANLWPVKNQPALIESVQRVSGKIRLFVIGYPSTDTDYVDAVRYAIAKDVRTMLIPGLPAQAVADALAAADLMLLASHAEVSPVTVMEAMSHRTPWIATPACGGVHDLAGGVITPLETFPAAIDYLRVHPEVCTELGALGYSHWYACFRWETVARQWDYLIQHGTLSELSTESEHVMRRTEQLRDEMHPHITVCQPVVSVIVPTHNRPEMVKDALQSILDQTFQDFEIIVVNDAGADVADVIADFASEKISYFRHATNKGLAAARNTGINAAKGKYIAYLDDDDRYYPDHLETLVQHLEATSHHVAYTEAYRACQQWQGDSYQVVKRDVPFSRDCHPDDILIDNCTPVLCVMHQRSCLEKTGLFDESLHRHEDWDLWIRMSRYYAFSHIRKLTCEFSHRLDESTMTGGNPLHFLASYREVCQKYREFAEGKPWIIRDQKRVEWNFLYAGYEYIEQQVAPLLIPVAAPVASQALQLQNLHRKGITDQQVAAATARLAAMAVVGDDNRAAALLREALQHDPEYLLARLELISRLLKTRALDEAAEHIELLLAMKPGDADLSCALADIFAAKGSVAAAQTILCTAAEANKDNPELAKRLALCQTFTVKTDQHSLKPACSIIIPVFNKLELTQPCLEAIKRFTESSLYELIVVDNASTDGTAEYLKNCGHARVISNQENKGFARACNQGACAVGTDLLLFLNNDTVVHEGWLQMLLDCLEQHPKAGIVGCRLLYPDGTVQHAGVGITVDGIGEHLFSGFSADYPAVIQPRLLQAVTAACMLVRRNCFNAVGGFDEGYINGFEDVDFCLKARRLGYDVRYCPDTRIVHYEESSPGRNLYESYNKQRFRQRWQSEIKPDFAAMYETAGLIRPIDCDEADDAYQCYGHRNGALFMYLQIIEKFPGDAGAYLNIARILLQYRRFDDAREFVEKALRITPYFKQAQELKHQLAIR